MSVQRDAADLEHENRRLRAWISGLQAENEHLTNILKRDALAERGTGPTVPGGIGTRGPDPSQTPRSASEKRDVDAEERCGTCEHPRGRHSSGGMCCGAFDGDECYCIRFPDAPDFAVRDVDAEARKLGYHPNEPCECDKPDRVLVSGDGVHLPRWWCSNCRREISR